MRIRRRYWLASTALLGIGVGGALLWPHVPREVLVASLPDSPVKDSLEENLENPIRRVTPADAKAREIVEAAKSQVGDSYDASYRVISYPNGDVPSGQGACTDVVVRAFRGAGIDLQKLIHDDMKAHFAAYPNTWKLGRTDTNIDHRRVPNHITFFKRFGEELPTGLSGNDLKTWQPGDVVEWKLEGGRWHTGVVSDGVGARGVPLVVHNGWKCVEQDCLDGWPIIAHFRYPSRKK